MSELNKRLHEATSTANEAKEEARLQRQGHAEVLAFCRESAQGCNTVTRKCIDDTRQYVAVEIRAKLEAIEAAQTTQAPSRASSVPNLALTLTLTMTLPRPLHRRTRLSTLGPSSRLSIKEQRQT